MTDLHDVEPLLDRFRQWLLEVRDEARSANPEAPGPGDETSEFGLYRLVEEFTALRQEVKLQTKGARGLQEQSEALLAGLRQAIEQFRTVEPKEAQAAFAAGKPLAEALADLDEAIDRGRAEIEKSRRQLVDEPARSLETDLDALFRRQSWLERRFSRRYHDQVVARVQQADDARRRLFDALLEGYGLIQSRLRRALQGGGIARIAAVGEPVDPERMTVVEVVDNPSRPSGEVIDEVRRGYTWQGRLLRFAEVRAVRARPHDERDHAESEPDVSVKRNGEIIDEEPGWADQE